MVSDKLGNARRAIVKAMFDGSQDVRYGLYKRVQPTGDTLVAVFVAAHQGGTFGDISESLEGRTGVMIEVAEPRAMEQRITVQAPWRQEHRTAHARGHGEGAQGALAARVLLGRGKGGSP